MRCDSVRGNAALSAAMLSQRSSSKASRSSIGNRSIPRDLIEAFIDAISVDVYIVKTSISTVSHHKLYNVFVERRAAFAPLPRMLSVIFVDLTVLDNVVRRTCNEKLRGRPLDIPVRKK